MQQAELQSVIDFLCYKKIIRRDDKKERYVFTGRFKALLDIYYCHIEMALPYLRNADIDAVALTMALCDFIENFNSDQLKLFITVLKPILAYEEAISCHQKP